MIQYSTVKENYADALFCGSYSGEKSYGSLVPDATVVAYPLEPWERERSKGDFKILVCETGEGFFYASADEVEVFVENLLAA
jgi:hypothetical protein